MCETGWIQVLSRAFRYMSQLLQKIIDLEQRLRELKASKRFLGDENSRLKSLVHSPLTWNCCYNAWILENVLPTKHLYELY